MGLSCKAQNSRLLWVLLLVIVIISISASSALANIITVEPSSSIIPGEEPFTIAVVLNASEPVKSFECRISFNKNAFSVNSVVVGDFFDYYITENKYYFNPGIIDNQAGSVSQLWGLILGPGNVTGTGTLFTLNCTAKNPSSDLTTWVTLPMAGITNETMYLDVSVVNASLIIDFDETLSPPPDDSSGGGGGGGGFLPEEPEPDITHPPVTPLPPTGPTSVYTSVDTTYRVSSWDPDGDTIRYRMNWDDGTLSPWSTYVESNITMMFTHQWSEIGNYTIKVIAEDEDGVQSNFSEGLKVTVIEAPIQDPMLENVTVDAFVSEENETIGFFLQHHELLNLSAYTFKWDFGDGTTGFGINPDHRYTVAGEYNVTVTITDHQGRKTIKTFTVIVPNTAEGSTISPDETGSDGFVGWWLILIGIAGSLAIAFIVFYKYFGISFK